MRPCRLEGMDVLEAHVVVDDGVEILGGALPLSE